MRNALVHHWFGIRLDETWSAVENDVPELKCRVEAIWAALPTDPGC